MFEIEWKDKKYTFNEDISNAEYKAVKENISETEKLMIAMSVEPKLTQEDVAILPKLVIMRFNTHLNSYLKDF
jgi:hypothetical protein